jgi:hypothetical protein
MLVALYWEMLLDPFGKKLHQPSLYRLVMLSAAKRVPVGERDRFPHSSLKINSMQPSGYPSNE